jgi:hypothetical protein
MKRFMAVLVLLGGSFLALPALADVACVQQHLTDLGFDPGPVDGALGKRTVRAATLLAANAGLSLETLSKGNSNVWCEAISAFAATPAARTVSTFDLVSEPEGILSPRNTQRQWDAYKTAKECFDMPTIAADKPQKVAKLSAEHFAGIPWTSPFTSVRGARQCAMFAGRIEPPKPIQSVRLDERYGERMPDVDQAADWFRRMPTFLRMSDDPVARALIKYAMLDWARANAFAKGIVTSYGAVDYTVMSTIASILAATGEVAADFTAEERQIVGPWLNRLVSTVGDNRYIHRSDNKAYMRAYITLLWGLMVGDDRTVQDAIFTYKLAIHDMRPDGTWPVDSQRGGMGLDYNSSATRGLVMIAVALKSARNVDLFDYAVDGRSIHDAVAWVIKSIEDPVEMAPIYAVPCPDSGDRWGSIAAPSTHFVSEAGYLKVYAALFPERPASVAIMGKAGRGILQMSEAIGGAATCQFATSGGEPLPFKPLVMPKGVALGTN